MKSEMLDVLPTMGLKAWQLRRLQQHAAIGLPSAVGPSSVTLMAYHFWESDRQDSEFERLAASLHEAWLQCGMLKTVLVVNCITPRLEAFAASAGGWVVLQTCKNLVPGNLYSMSADCIGRLAERFDSDYVLIVQNDGFPVRSGLDGFLGRYDYIGAPWVFGKDNRITRLLLPHGHDVGNGGFSLRSKALCDLSAWYYRRCYRLIPECYLVTEDYFICKTLPSFERRYRETIRIAPPEVAATFSLEDNVALHDALDARPFGFHGEAAFRRLLKEGKIPDVEMLGGRKGQSNGHNAQKGGTL